MAGKSIPEVIITSGSVCAARDSKTGNVLANYPKCGKISPKTLCLLGEDYLIGAVPNRPVIKMWMVANKKEEMGNFVCPGVVSALTVSRCGTYCVAGIKQSTYVWQVSTGELMNVIERHYQDVTCLKFSGDDSRVLSGGKDGLVIVWTLAQMIDISKLKGSVNPLVVWNHHSSEVTDIYVGPLSSRVATVSADMSCRVYELDSLMLLSSICTQSLLTAVIMDPIERYIFLGDCIGCVYQIDTYQGLPIETHPKEAQLKIHEGKIISFSFSIEGSRLLTASEDGTCKLWNFPYISCIKTIRIEGCLTNAFLAMRPTGLTEFIHAKTLTFMHEDEPDEVFTENLLNTPVTTTATVDKSTSESKFQDAVCPETIAGLRTVNNQLYSYLLKCGMEKIQNYPSSET
ncbi:WD repeat-containing protein 18 [Trichonephila clavipes]|nr:WD repeat-containing protein 18 [Trichonephila clavipes]